MKPLAVRFVGGLKTLLTVVSGASLAIEAFCSGRGSFAYATLWSGWTDRTHERIADVASGLG